jgi:hypothetical protein
VRFQRRFTRLLFQGPTSLSASHAHDANRTLRLAMLTTIVKRAMAVAAHDQKDGIKVDHDNDITCSAATTFGLIARFHVSSAIESGISLGESVQSHIEACSR